MITTNNNLCITNCTHKKKKIINLSLTVKSIFEIIYKDISDYIFELGSMQQYFGYNDINDQNMVDCFLAWYDTLTNIFYTRLSNHLLIRNDFEGIGKPLISKWKDIEGERKSSIKYHEICDKESPNMGITKNIVTFDNISLELEYEEPSDLTIFEDAGITIYNIGGLDQVNTGFRIRIGDYGDFLIDNGSGGRIDPGLGDNLSLELLNNLYSHIDEKMNELSELLRIIENNINLIQKYTEKFMCT